MAKQDSVLQVDTNVPSSRNSGTVASILGAKDRTKSEATLQSKNLEDTAKAMSKLDSNVKKLQKNISEFGIDPKSIEFIKEFNRALKNFEDSMGDANSILSRGSTNISTLAKNVEKSNNAYDELNMYYSIINKQIDKQSKAYKQLDAEQKKSIKNQQADLRTRKEIRSNQRKSIEADSKEGSKSVSQAVSKMAGETQKLLTNLKTVISLDKLTSNTRSASAQIQLDSMANFGLNRSEFNKFKHDLYNEIDTAAYSPQDFKDAVASLNAMGINSTQEAVGKMNTIIRGQKLLGMSSEQQAKLQQLGNKTGRDSLTFTTNKMAKWLQMSNNIGTKQLAELVDLNTNFLSQFADIGVDSEAFTNTTESATAALTAMTGNTEWAQRYQSMLTGLATDTNTSAAAVGMSAGEVKERLQNGDSAADIIYNSGGTYRDLYDRFMSDYDGTVKNMDIITGQQGIDPATASFIKEMAKYDKENGAEAFGGYLKSYDVSGEDSSALKSLEQQSLDATSDIQKGVNKLTNWITDKFDWVSMSNLESSLTIIIGLLTAIAASDVISSIGSLFKGAGKFLTKGTNLQGTSLLGGSGPGGKLFGGGSFLGGTSGVSKFSYGNGALGVASKAAGIGGLAWTAVDAFKGATSLSNEIYADKNGKVSAGNRVKGGVIGALSGSTVQKDKEGKVDVTKNTLKGIGSGAAKGALIGSFFGPVGTAIGAGIGGIAGGIAGWRKGKDAKKKEKEQEEREKAQLKAQEKIAENTKHANDLLDRNYSVSEAARNVRAYRAYTGQTGAGPDSAAVPGYSPSNKPIDAYTQKLLEKGLIGMGGTSGGNSGLPWKITSPFGPRTLSNGDSSFHKGVDFGIKTGTPIGAPVSGKVTSAVTDNRNTYPGGPTSAGSGIYLQGDNGVTYQFWHLSKVGVNKGDRVSTGQTIGLSGNTGYSTGSHLHYGTKVGGTWVNPVPSYTTNGLFSADGKMISGVFDSSAIPQIEGESSNKTSVFNNKLRSFTSDNSTDGMGAVVEGLAEIKQTLIDLAARQTRDEQIMTMLQSSKKPEPRTA